jgi:hypothetical protein
VANPGRDLGSSAGSAQQRASIQMRAGRPPQPANDNPLGLARSFRQMAPMAAAIALLAWALWSAFL